ncbi:hypothetical protein [Streptomyces sp. G-G2]|uniref:hypothetical protein n=1 Tax=Streptomyces sp. G-G2 TaxID=3046201 RepID=UPI0024BB0DB0|nr:hypothetical protein [Streptomyces sp. G-G2]MDJ0383720.1 hypothetical protein [Streptomyces sp. G-G2]
MEVHRHPGTPLVGDECLAVIVRTPAGARTRAHIRVAATVGRRRLGLIPYRADLPAAPRTLTVRG